MTRHLRETPVPGYQLSFLAGMLKGPFNTAGAQSGWMIVGQILRLVIQELYLVNNSKVVFNIALQLLRPGFSPRPQERWNG